MAERHHPELESLDKRHFTRYVDSRTDLREETSEPVHVPISPRLRLDNVGALPVILAAEADCSSTCLEQITYEKVETSSSFLMKKVLWVKFKM